MLRIERTSVHSAHTLKAHIRKGVERNIHFNTICRSHCNGQNVVKQFVSNLVMLSTRATQSNSWCSRVYHASNIVGDTRVRKRMHNVHRWCFPLLIFEYTTSILRHTTCVFMAILTACHCYSGERVRGEYTIHPSVESVVVFPLFPSIVLLSTAKHKSGVWWSAFVKHNKEMQSVFDTSACTQIHIRRRGDLRSFCFFFVSFILLVCNMRCVWRCACGSALNARNHSA